MLAGDCSGVILLCKNSLTLLPVCSVRNGGSQIICVRLSATILSDFQRQTLRIPKNEEHDQQRQSTLYTYLN